MAGKQIIINGVDVSECEHLQYKGCNFAQCLVKMASFDLKCKGYNCYFKQLKRKEQKLKEITDYCKGCNLKADFTACDILQIIEGE